LILNFTFTFHECLSPCSLLKFPLAQSGGNCLHSPPPTWTPLLYGLSLYGLYTYMQTLAVNDSSNSTILVCHCLITQLFHAICDCDNLLVGSGAKPQPIYESFKCVCQFVFVSLGHFSELGGFCRPPRGVEKILSLGGQKSS